MNDQKGWEKVDFTNRVRQQEIDKKCEKKLMKQLINAWKKKKKMNRLFFY